MLLATIKALFVLDLQRKIATPQVDYSKPKALLGVLNHLQSQIEQKYHVIAELTPKAQAFEGLKRSDGLFGLIKAAKMLEARLKDLTNYLRKNYWGVSPCSGWSVVALSG